MKNAKLIDILKSFTKEECKDLSTFVEYAKVKENTSVHQLFFYLIKYYPEFAENKIEKVKVYKKLFPLKKYDENKLSKIMSELTKILEEYIITRQSKSNELSNKIQLLRFYNERNLEKHYKQIEKEIEKLLENIPIGVLTQTLAYQYEEIRITHDLKTNDRDANYQKVYNVLTAFTDAEKLRWQNLSNISLFPKLKEDKNHTILYIVNKKIETLLNTNNEQILFEILEFFKVNNTKIEDEQKRDILYSLLYYCITQINSGNSIYYPITIDMFHSIETNKLILNYYNKIDLSTYKNYITISLKINKIDEAELFLEKYKKHLPDEIKEEVYSFNKALILFEKQNYSDVLDLLLHCKFTDVFYKLNQRRLIIKTYYELLNTDSTYFNSISDAITAFKKYLLSLRNIPENYILLNKNFLKFTDILLSKNKISKEEIKNLLEKLKNIKHVSERNWIEEKILHQHNFVK
jgi:hypothetical protein